MPRDTIREAAQFLVEGFFRDLGIRGGRIWAPDDADDELLDTFGTVARAPIGLRIPRAYPPFDQLQELGAVVTRRDDPRLESDLGTRDWFAAVVVKRKPESTTEDTS